MALNHTSTETLTGHIVASFDRPIQEVSEFKTHGNHRLAGIARINGAAGKARVVAYQRMSGIKARETISAADGSWAFDHIAAGEYTVIATSLNRSTRAAVSDCVRAVAMEG